MTKLALRGSKLWIFRINIRFLFAHAASNNCIREYVQPGKQVDTGSFSRRRDTRVATFLRDVYERIIPRQMNKQPGVAPSPLHHPRCFQRVGTVVFLRDLFLPRTSLSAAPVAVSRSNRGPRLPTYNRVC